MINSMLRLSKLPYKYLSVQICQISFYFYPCPHKRAKITDKAFQILIISVVSTYMTWTCLGIVIWISIILPWFQWGQQLKNLWTGKSYWMKKKKQNIITVVKITLWSCCSTTAFAWKQRALLGWCRHSLKLVFGMINDSCNLQGKVQALLRLGEGNWTALGKRVGGPHSSL